MKRREQQQTLEHGILFLFHSLIHFTLHLLTLPLSLLALLLFIRFNSRSLPYLICNIFAKFNPRLTERTNEEGDFWV
jgi:hypothetical protein